MQGWGIADCNKSNFKFFKRIDMAIYYTQVFGTADPVWRKMVDAMVRPATDMTQSAIEGLFVALRVAPPAAIPSFVLAGTPPPPTHIHTHPINLARRILWRLAAVIIEAIMASIFKLLLGHKLDLPLIMGFFCPPPHPLPLPWKVSSVCVLFSNPQDPGKQWSRPQAAGGVRQVPGGGIGQIEGGRAAPHVSTQQGTWALLEYFNVASALALHDW